MLQIILFFIVVCVIISVAKLALEAALKLGASLLYFVGCLLIAPAAVLHKNFLMPYGLAFFVYLLTAAIAIGRYCDYCGLEILALPVAIVIIYFLYAQYAKLKLRHYLKAHGVAHVSELPATKEIREWFQKNNCAIVWGSYVVYRSLLDKLKPQIQKENIFLPEDLQTYAVKLASKFQTRHVYVLADFLQECGSLLIYAPSVHNTVYLSASFTSACLELLQRLGCATAKEFVLKSPEITQNEKIDPEIRENLAEALLQNFVQSKNADAVNLSKLDDTL